MYEREMTEVRSNKQVEICVREQIAIKLRKSHDLMEIRLRELREIVGHHQWSWSVRVEVNSCVWNHFSRVAYTLDLTRFLLDKCRTKLSIEWKVKKKTIPFFLHHHHIWSSFKVTEISFDVLPSLLQPPLHSSLKILFSSSAVSFCRLFIFIFVLNTHQPSSF